MYTQRLRQAFHILYVIKITWANRKRVTGHQIQRCEKKLIIARHDAASAKTKNTLNVQKVVSDINRHIDCVNESNADISNILKKLKCLSSDIYIAGNTLENRLARLENLCGLNYDPIERIYEPESNLGVIHSLEEEKQLFKRNLQKITEKVIHEYCEICERTSLLEAQFDLQDNITKINNPKSSH